MKDNSPRANTALKILKIYSGSLILGIVSSVLQYLAYKNFLASINMNDFTDADMPFRSLQGLKGLLQYQNIIAIINFMLVGLFIANSITFIQWFRRSYYNYHILELTKPSYGEGMAAGAWWIPIGNLFIPLTIFNELWNGYNKELGNENPGKSGISLAWGLWVITWTAGIIGAIYIASTTMGTMIDNVSATRLSNGIPTTQFIEMMTEMMSYMMVLSIVVTAIMMTAGFMMAGVIQKISNLEEKVLEKYLVTD